MIPFSKKNRFWFAPLIIGGLAALTAVAMLLWNALLPNIFHLPVITYWQTLGLLVLSRLLFGFGGHFRPHHAYPFHNLREKWVNMTPEEREKFRDQLRDRRRFWDDYRDEKKEEK
jgi:hypothetical protein